MLDKSYFEASKSQTDDDASDDETCENNNNTFIQESKMQYDALNDVDKLFRDFSEHQTKSLSLNPKHFLTMALNSCATIYAHLNRSLNGCNAQLSITGRNEISIVRLNPRRSQSQYADEWAPKLKTTINNFIVKNLSYKSIRSNANVDLSLIRKVNLKECAILRVGNLIAIVGYSAAVTKAFKQTEDVLLGNPAVVFNEDNVESPTRFNNTAKPQNYANVKEFISYFGDGRINLRLNKFQASFLRKSTQILADFQADLHSINARINIDKLIIEPEHEQISENWSNLVCSKIEDYFIKFTKFKVIPIPKFYTTVVELKNKIDEYLKSNRATNKVYYELTNTIVKFGAYREIATKLNPYIRKLFAKVQRELYNKNHPLLCLELDEVVEPKIKLLFYRKDDHYYNLYKTKLEDLNASCLKTNDNKIKIVNMSLDPNSKRLEAKLMTWKEKINKFNRQFFNQYSSVKFDIPPRWSNDYKNNFNDLFVQACYSDRSINAIGPKKMLDEFVKLCKE